MASSLKKIILISLVLSITIPISIGNDEDSDDENNLEYDSEPETDYPDDSDGGSDDSEIGRYLKDLCSDTKKSNQCWRIIKREKDRFTDTDSRKVASVVIDLAIHKSNNFSHLLKRLRIDSIDDELKKKYKSCAENYDNANEYLEEARGNLDSDNYPKIRDCVKHVKKELKSCKRQFGKNAYDPAHIKDRNKEFGGYVNIVKTATKRFLKENGSS